jgi:hypothetical protein
MPGTTLFFHWLIVTLANWLIHQLVKFVSVTSLHLHLLLNHAPAIGFMFGGFLLLIANLKNSRLSGSIALIIFIICGVTSIVVFQAG